MQKEGVKMIGKRMTLLDIKNHLARSYTEFTALETWWNVEAITDSLKIEIRNQNNTIHRRNMQIENLKKQLKENVL